MTGRQASKENPKDAATPKGLMPNGLAADGTPIYYHVIGGLAKHDYADDVPKVQCIFATSISKLLWAQHRGANLVCIADSVNAGRRYVDFRQFYRTVEGWKPTRHGCTIPIESFQSLLEALNAFPAGMKRNPANDIEGGIKSA